MVVCGHQHVGSLRIFIRGYYNVCGGFLVLGGETGVIAQGQNRDFQSRRQLALLEFNASKTQTGSRKMTDWVREHIIAGHGYRITP